MSNTTKVLTVSSLLACLLMGRVASAQSSFTIDFDENGNATVANFNGSTYTEMGTLMPDQSGAFPGTNVLTYDLPEFVGGGGLNVVDLNGAIAHNLYFYAGANFSEMEYLSPVGGGSLANTGVTDFGFTGAVESPTGTFTFVAGNGNPATTNFYIGSSNTAVPEPGSIALLVGMSLSGAGFLVRRRKNARQAA